MRMGTNTFCGLVFAVEHFADQPQKTRIRPRKWISESQPKKRGIFKHFRKRKPQQISKNIGKIPPKKIKQQQNTKN